MKKLVVMLLVVMSVSLSVRADLAYPVTAGATTLLLDEFNGTAVNTSVWNVSGNATIQKGDPSVWTPDGSSLYLNSPAVDSTVGISSKQGFSPTMFGNQNGKIIVSIGGSFAGFWEKAQFAFLSNGTLSTSGLTGATQNIGIQSYDVGYTTILANGSNQNISTGDNHSEGWYQIIWSKDRVIAYQYDNLILDTAITPHPTGGTWQIPNGNTLLSLNLFAQWPGFDQTTDYVRVEYVPEPATMSLIGLGALGLLGRRNK